MSRRSRPDVQELRQLSASRLNELSRAKLLSALQSKWDDIKVVAAQSLCAAGDAQGVVGVKATLGALVPQPGRSSAVSAIVRALGPRLDPKSDLEWAASLFLHASHVDNQFYVGILFENFSPAAVVTRLGREPSETWSAGRRRLVEGAINRARYRQRNEA
jgi:hypothetical protein